MINNNITYRIWDIEVDKVTTKLAYANLENSSAESCGCTNCLNYHNYRKNVFPAEIDKLLAALGVDKHKEPEISHLTRVDSGLHLYWGWFEFKGSFTGKDCTMPFSSGNGSTLETEKITENFGIGFTKANTAIAFENSNGIIQLHFECKIPWILDRNLETD